MINYSLLYLMINWALIGAAIVLAQWKPIFYPFCFLIIANRQFANFLLGHEAVHGVLSKNIWINQLVGKYFCLFPVFVSLDSYKNYHLAHHEFLGTQLDPDKSFYDFYPIQKKTFLKTIFYSFITLRILRDFLIYFTPFYRLYKSKQIKGDSVEYFLFQIIPLGLCFVKGWLFSYLIYWFLPLLLLTPYYFFVNALQHGLIHQNASGNSRNIIGHSWLMEILLPCQTHLHGVHHQYPNVAFYHLHKVQNSKNLPVTTFLNCVNDLFRKGDIQ